VAADAAVVALLLLLEPHEVRVEFLGIAPGGAVDALELRVLGVAAPIRAGDLGQPEGVADLAGRLEMRSAAQVVPVAMPVDRHVLARRDALDQLGLVALAHAPEM